MKPKHKVATLFAVLCALAALGLPFYCHAVGAALPSANDSYETMGAIGWLLVTIGLGLIAGHLFDSK